MNNEKIIKSFERELLKKLKNYTNIYLAWYFGSHAKQTNDSYSDLDIVMLVSKDSFNYVSNQINNILSSLSVEILLEYPEEFNNDSCKNFCYLLKVDNSLFQLDLFYINENGVDDFFSKIHLQTLNANNIIHRNGHNIDISKLVKKVKQEKNYDITSLLDSFWFHAFQLIKYIYRKSILKMMQVLTKLYEIHADLELNKVDMLPIDNRENNISRYLDSKTQSSLEKYFINIGSNLHIIQIYDLLHDFKSICSLQNYDMDICDSVIHEFSKIVD